MRVILAGLSAFICIASLVSATAVYFAPSGGGFFTDQNGAIAILILGVANATVLVLNACYWRIYGAPLWLRAVVIIQFVPALVCLGLLTQAAYGMLVDLRVNTQW